MSERLKFLNPIEYSTRNPPNPLHHSLDSITYTKIIQSTSLIHGQLAHTHMIKTSFKPCLFLINNLLNMYCKHGHIDVAHQLFEKIPKRNIVSYNLLVNGYSKMGFYEKAVNVFNQARMEGLKLDKFTFAGALNLSAHSGCIGLGKVIHGLVIVNGLDEKVVLINALIDMYGKCGRIDLASVLFENSKELDEISWNSLIAGYGRTGESKEMLRVLVGMHRYGLKLTTYTVGSVLKACCTILDHSIICGKMIHGCVIKLGLALDVVVGTALLDMYMKNRQVHDAVQVFELTPYRNVVMYNAMISGFVQLETNDDQCSNEAFRLFSSMLTQGIKPSKFTFSSILKACNDVEYGKQIHAQICKNNFQSDEFIGSALIEFYSLLGLTEDCLKCFSSTPKLDVVLWTSMISCYIQNGQFERAFALFYEILASKMKPDEYVISSIMSACANLSTGRSGEQVHGYVEKTGIVGFTVIQNSLICMYAKSGDIDSASKIFNVTENPNVVSWSVMIHSHAQHGCAREALDLFELMKNRGVFPNHITFLGVLAACSHGGLVDEGLRYHESMKKDYKIIPNARHCASVVDLLGRAGKLDAAETFILNSGFDDNPVMWQALLSACRVYKDIVRGKRVAERVIELEPQSAAPYVLIYNIYTDANIELPAARIRELMTEREVKKEPGLSWIEIGNKVHSFVVGDKSHPMSQKIHARLEEMLEKIKKIGSMDKLLVPCATEEERESTKVLSYHSEKLAVAFGIITLPILAPVKVMKNLRVCEDCHTTMKHFSLVERERSYLEIHFVSIISEMVFVLVEITGNHGESRSD